MKKYLPYILLAAIILPGVSMAEEDAEMMIEAAERQLELANVQLEREKVEMEFNFERQMRELELEKARLEIESAHRRLRRHGMGKPHGPMCVILIIALLNRILAPVWIYKDMRKRNAGSVMLVLFGILGGLFALLIYSVIRLGDITAAKPSRGK